MTRHLFTAVLINVLLIGNCSKGIELTDDGGGTEITGRVVITGGSPADNAVVCLLDVDGRLKFAATANEDGMYRFGNGILRGKYTLQGTLDSLTFIAFDVVYDESFRGRVDTLKNSGSIHASVFLDNSANREGIEVYIPGTSFFGKTGSSGSVTLFNVPPGKFQVVFAREYYLTHDDSALVLAGASDTIGPVTLKRDYTKAVPLPVPTNLRAEIDTFTGTVTLKWDSVTQSITGYTLSVVDTTILQGYKASNSINTRNTWYGDTLFTDKVDDTAEYKFRQYQVRAFKGLNDGEYGSICSVTVKRPMVPPAPGCSITNVSGSMFVAVSVLQPGLWWIDSVFIFRSVYGGEAVGVAKLPFREAFVWSDRVNTIPAVTDSAIPVMYTLYSMSKYGLLSGPSEVKTIYLANPYLQYTLATPPKPRGLLPEENAGRYSITIPAAVASPLPDDTIQYRIRITNDSGDSAVVTAWYTIPVIDVSLLEGRKYFLQSQVQSRNLPGLVSPLSDTLTVNIHQTHSVPTPATPVGEVVVTLLNPYAYTSSVGNACTNGHAILIRYVVAYQSESVSDSTSWLATPNSSATIIWSKPGIAFLRAQTRCSTDPLIVSLWSDALVVTVK